MAKSTSACLDTSVLLRLLVGEPEKQATIAEEALDELRKSGGKAFVSDLLLCETYFALQCHYKVPKKEAIEVLKNLSQSEEIECSTIARSVLTQTNLHSANPGFVDRLIHAQYETTGAPMLTFEKASKKLPNTRVL
jgi:predicted nucleic-acid-binding protein